MRELGSLNLGKESGFRRLQPIGNREACGGRKGAIMKAIKIFKALWKDERGQSTTEYILILSVVVMIAMKFKSSIGGKINVMVEKLGGDIQKAQDDMQ